MGRFIKGSIIVINFPFSNLKGSKPRPAYVLSDLEIEESIIVCQITKSKHTDGLDVKIDSNNIKGGNIKYDSYIRANVIFTLDTNNIKKTLGYLTKDKIIEVNKRFNEIFKTF